MNPDKLRKLFRVENPGPFAFIDTGFPVWIDEDPDWESHFAGEKSLCVTPIGRNSTCYWGALDIDAKGDAPAVDYVAVQEFLTTHNLPLNLFASRSGKGAHIYLFSAKPILASEMINILKIYSLMVSPLLNKANGIEIFPKQSTLGIDENGSCIRPPYFGSKCQPIHPADPKPKETLTLPPCLESMPDEGERNNFIYHITNFLVLGGAINVRKLIHNVNEEMEWPLEHEEVERTVASAQRQRNRKGAKFGLGCTSCPDAKKTKCRFASQLRSKEVMGAMEVMIVHYLAEDPKIKLIVEGKSLVFDVEEVFNNHKVRLDFITKHRSPSVPMMKKGDWNNILHQMLEEADHVDELTHRDKGHFILQQLRKWAKDFKPGVSNMYSGTPIFISEDEVLIFSHDVFNRFNTIGIQGVTREDVNITLESIGTPIVINGDPAIKIPVSVFDTKAVGLEIPIISDIDPDEIYISASSSGKVVFKNKEGVQIDLTNTYIKEHKDIQQRILEVTKTDIGISF